MPIYTKESLENLRKKIDLVDVLESTIDLKRSGAAFKALCPFHDEKTPSFMIHRGDTHYHCYGCGAHGDAIQFLMSYQKMDFSQAIEYLAGKFQVSLEMASNAQEAKGPPRTKLKEALKHASRLYHFLLLHTDLGKEPFQYLLNRGFTIEFIQQFEIGFAPNEPRVFHAFFKEKDYSEEILLNAGLITPGNREFFSDRITFPIRDAMGSVIGFSARKFKEETYGGKYINTKETPLFKKSKVLFGLNYSRRKIAKDRKALIVEGQIDALWLIHHGFDFAVAGQGTAFGEEHVQELLHLGPQTIYLALDSDVAGIAATIKIGDLFQKEGLDVRVVGLPKGSDPDLYLRTYGKEAFQNLLDTSIDYLSFIVKERSQEITSPASKNEMITELVKQIRGWNHPVMVHESLKKLALLTQTPEDMIGLKDIQAPNLFIKRSASIGQVEIDPHRILEVDLLRWLLLMDNSKLKSIAAKNLSPKDFFVSQCQKIYAIYQNSEHPSLLSLALELEEGEGEAFINEISGKKINREKAEAQFVETLQKLLERNWMIERESIKNQIQNGQISEDKVMELVKQFDAIKSSPPKVAL